MYWRQCRLFFRELVIKIAGIRTSVLQEITSIGEDSMGNVTYDSREVRRRNTLVENVIKIDVLEEWMLLDLFRIALARSKTTGRVPR